MSASRLRRAATDERGIALVTAMLVTSAAIGISVVALTIAIHNETASSYDRKRVVAVQAAEAGLNQVQSFYRTASTAEVCSPPSSATNGTITAGPGGRQLAQFVVTVQCDNPTNPVQVQLNSVGYAPSATASGRAVRKMETLIKLHKPAGVQNAFTRAMFHASCTTDLQLRNNLRGNNFGTAGIYACGNVRLANNVQVSGGVTARGNVTMNQNSHVTGSVWASGDVTLNNSSFVGGSVTASLTGKTIGVRTGARIQGNARAGGAITVYTGGRISGSQTPNSPSDPPPVETLPTFAWNPADPAWPQPVVNFTTCTGTNSADTWFSTNRTGLLGTMRIQGATNCTFPIAGNTTETMAGDLAIVVNGGISMSQYTKWVSGDGRPHTLYLIALGGDISFNNSTTFDPLINVFIYTTGTANLQNTNMFNGCVYANVISIQNQFTLNYVAISPPGFGGSIPNGYDVDTLYIREVKV